MKSITPKSVTTALFGLWFVAVLIHFAGAADGLNRLMGGGYYSLPMPSLIFMLLVVGIHAAVWKLRRRPFYSTGEFFFIFMVVLVAAPLNAQGFWRRSLSMALTAASESQWDRYDWIDRGFWPNGPDLLEGHLKGSAAAVSRTTGNVTLVTATHSGGEEGPAMRLRNDTPGEVSSFELEIPLASEEAAGIRFNRDYLFLFLGRADSFGNGSRYDVQVYFDDSPTFALEAAQGQADTSPNHLQPEGFRRQGHFGIRFSRGAIGDRVRIRFRLTGPGEWIVAEPEFRDVSAILDALRGIPSIAQSEYEALPIPERAGMVVRPDNLLSLAGLRFVLGGYGPLGQWWGPMGRYATWLVLLLTGSFGVALLFRRQWMEAERFPMPADQPVIALLPGNGERALPGVCYRPAFLWGAGVSLIYWTFVLWNAFDANVPSPYKPISVGAYIDGPAWGDTWRFDFRFDICVFAFALLLETHILASLLAGFLFHRLQHAVGQAPGWTINRDYPFPSHQVLGGVLVYGIFVLAASRRYLCAILRGVWGIGKRDEETADAIPAARAGTVLIAGSLAGIALWAALLGLRVTSMLTISAVLLLVFLVAARIWAECGVLRHGWMHEPLMKLVPVIGGVGFLGATESTAFGMFLIITLFGGILMVPGLQLSFLEIGRRREIPHRTVGVACLVAVGGGLCFGGWAFLSGCYAQGAENYYHAGEFFPWGKPMGGVIESMSELDRLAGNPEAEPAGIWSGPEARAMAFNGGLTAVVAVLRQLFSGFWLHPVGVFMGASGVMTSIWGGAFCAFVVRMVALKLGGAHTVRELLVPCAIGLIVGTVGFYVAATFINGWVDLTNPGGTRFIFEH